MSTGGSSNKAVVAALLGNVAVASLKFVVGFLAGSAAMVSEAIHSTVDTGNQGMLLFGLHRSRKPPDDQHPFGHGRELYFWGLMVAVSIFGIGGGISIYEGILRLHDTAPPEGFWNYLVLAGAAVFEGSSLFISYREFRRSGRPGQTVWQAIRQAKDPSIYTVVVEDSLDILGLAVAAVAILLARRLGAPWLDAVGSILIGVMLALAALLLVREAHGMIVGESVDDEMSRGLQDLVAKDAAVIRARLPLTMYLGPHSIMAAFQIEFRPELPSAQLTDTVDRIESAVKDAYPAVKQVFIEADSLKHPDVDERWAA